MTKTPWKRVLLIIAAILSILCIICIGVPLLYAETPGGKEALSKTYSTRTAAAVPSKTSDPPTPSFSLTSTRAPSLTASATYTFTPTNTTVPTQTPIPSRTFIPTKTPIPSKTPIPTKTLTPTKTQTAIPNSAGASDWLIKDGVMVGARKIAFDNYLGYYRAERGKIYVSLYIVVVNASESEASVLESDIGLVDGGGAITNGVIFGSKAPTFSSCTLKPGGTCEGWWTTMILDKAEVRDSLSLRWDPCLIFCDPLETKIQP